MPPKTAIAQTRLAQSRILQLQQQLEQSAFRRGTSAFRYGLIPQAPSDHLPITALVTPSNLPALNLMSWNLLADAHLYNNFMNITGSSLLKQVILESETTNIYCSAEQNMLYHFFSELAQFLYKNKSEQGLIINRSLFKAFIHLENQPSKLARSRDPNILATKIKLTQASREQIVRFFMDSQHPFAAEFQLAIRHSLELIHHIAGDGGALQWKNRFQHIVDNIPLQLRMQRMDFICLQECTNPSDIEKLLNHGDNHYASLSFTVDQAVSDHCVIIYDTQKYILESHINYAIEGKKPAIFARFYPKEKPLQAFIVASIHYPGGEHHLMEVLIKTIQRLHKSTDENLPYFILGDYNHSADFFQDIPKPATLIFPDSGTMAGSDFGNTNQAIDGMCTNVTPTCVNIQKLTGLPGAYPAQNHLMVQFEQSAKSVVSINASPRFFGQPVQDTVALPVAERASELLGNSEPKLTPPIILQDPSVS